MSAKLLTGIKRRGLRALLHRIGRWFHACDWETTGTNGFYQPTEQWCRECGKYRHMVLEVGLLGSDVDDWKPGKHPRRLTNRSTGPVCNATVDFPIGDGGIGLKVTVFQYRVEWSWPSDREENWKFAGVFEAGAKWRDGRPVNDETMKEELSGYRLTWPERAARIVKPDGTLIQ